MYSKLLFLISLFCFANGKAQTIYKGIILDAANYNPVSDALIILNNNADFTSSDSSGAFQFRLQEGTTTFHLEISVIGCDQHLTKTFSLIAVDTIKLDCPPIKLDEVIITYTDPKSIVREAVKKIPLNYADSTFATTAFYRHYQKINGRYFNLTEAQSTVMFRTVTSRNSIDANEAISLQALRKSDVYMLPEGFSGDDYKDMLGQNPIYHLFNSSLSPEKTDDLRYYISPLSNDSLWIIYYTAKNYSSENHGIGEFNPNDFYGEADETGTLVIDKQSYAFLKIERKSQRNKKYHYPKYNNFLYPDNDYTGEFIDGYLSVTYKKIDSKYYPEQILHSYTNEFFASITYEKSFSITDYFEWFAGNPIYVVSKETMQQFIEYTSIRESSLKYYPEQWIIPLPATQLIPNSELFPALETEINLDTQFRNNGK